MKKILIIISSLCIVALLLSLVYFKKLFAPNPDSIKVKNITMETRVDSLSYALGTVWSKDIRRSVKIKGITYSFYSGVRDYYKKDTSRIGMYTASKYLHEHAESFANEKIWPANDSNIRICDIPLKTKFDTFSYSLGFAWANGAYGIGITQITPALLKGLIKEMQGDSSVFVNYAAANDYLMSYIEGLRMQKYAYYKKTNEDWLKANAKNEGVKTLPCGVQYKVMKSGSGKLANDQDVIECNYIGKLIDGRVFDNAYSTGPTFRFYLGSVMPGWQEALKLMKEGDEWIIYIPHHLAYGSGGMGDLVPPYSTVMLNVALVSVKEPR